MQLTQARVRELFDYREDGQIIRKITVNYRAKAGSTAGHLKKNGYLYVSVDGKELLAHRVIFMMHHGFLPFRVDHEDQDTLNNRISNLRAATQSENLCNRGKQSNNKSGVKGVRWNKTAKKWSAEIEFKGTKHYLGLFIDKNNAALAYQDAAKRLHGEFSRF